MYIILGSNNKWSNLELFKWFGGISAEDVSSKDNGITLEVINPESTGHYDDKQAHREFIAEHNDDAAVKIVLSASHCKTDAVIRYLDEKGFFQGDQPDDDLLLLVTNDTVVRHDGLVRNSPDTPQQAREYLCSYRGTTFECVCGVVITNLRSRKRLEGVSLARVFVRDAVIPDHIIDLIVSKPAILRAPGAFIPDDPLFQPYVERIEGSTSTVFGLPKDLTLRLMADHRFMIESSLPSSAATTAADDMHSDSNDAAPLSSSSQQQHQQYSSNSIFHQHDESSQLSSSSSILSAAAVAGVATIAAASSMGDLMDESNDIGSLSNDTSNSGAGMTVHV